MYKGKPVIIQKRPWYRSPVFPWGWYSLIQDNLMEIGKVIDADGYFKPNDNGGGKFRGAEYNPDHSNDGNLIVPVECSSSWIRQYEEEK
jgi:hypothetical protein